MKDKISYNSDTIVRLCADASIALDKVADAIIADETIESSIVQSLTNMSVMLTNIAWSRLSKLASHKV